MTFIYTQKINGTWHHYSHISVPRYYELFGRMAGVRRKDIEPIASPRGFPSDVTVVTKLDYQAWGVDAHTPSWLDSRQILALSEWMRERDLEESELLWLSFWQ